ncbi:Zinc finger, C3HC4 type (RING finger) [Musa troglodytarum]|nr:Zinc finger, C3HC4 type (RING finger) [Musa troglodytarum]
MNLLRCFSSGTRSQMPPVAGNNDGARALPLALLMRMAMRVSRARWFSFLRRVFRYQNGSRSDLVSNPFNARPWLALELATLVAQVVIVTVTMATSRKENPVWPLRIWLTGYNMGNLLSLPLIYWRYRHSTAGLNTDVEQQRSNDDSSSSSSYLMNKSRTFLELFFAMWFVMGNVWIFDSRHGSFDRAPKLHVLCVSILAWNAILYSFPFLLFLLLCCCVPFISHLIGYNIGLASTERGASEDQIARLPRWRFKDVKPTADDDLGNENQECCICLARYSDKEEVRQLPCLHVFHLNCVDQWLRIMSACPLCKQGLEN